MKKRVIIYSSGICCCSVCAPMDISIEEITEQVNALNPTGIKSMWVKSSDTHFSGGQPNPSVCNQDPSRIHYLFSC